MLRTQNSYHSGDALYFWKDGTVEKLVSDVDLNSLIAMKNKLYYWESDGIYCYNLSKKHLTVFLVLTGMRKSAAFGRRVIFFTRLRPLILRSRSRAEMRVFTGMTCVYAKENRWTGLQNKTIPQLCRP